MNFQNKNILLISPDPWDHIFVSKHHYAVHLGRLGNKVFFLDPPGRHNAVTATNVPNVFEVKYTGFPRGLRFYPSIIQRRIIHNVYKTIEAMCSTRFDIVWSFDNSVFFDFSALPKRLLKISHIVDHNQDFQTGKAASTADFSFCPTESLREKLAQYTDNVFKIPHGFNVPSPAKINRVMLPGKVTALYAGNLAIPYIDWPLLLTTIAANPSVDFLFIGPNKDVFSSDAAMRDAKMEVLRYPNVSVFGPVDSDALAAYYKLADVLLVAYREEFQSGQVTNAHKIMEYLGAGKVIVATHTSEYIGFDPCIVMSARNSEWCRLFTDVVGRLDCYNAETLQQQRQQYAWKNSYDHQISKIQAIVNKGCRTVTTDK